MQELMKMSKDAAELLSLMGNSKRLLILLNLVQVEMTSGELAKKVDLSQSSLSQHLARLRHGNLVKARRETPYRYYSVSSEAVIAVVKTLESIYVGDQALDPKENGGKSSQSESMRR